MTGWATEFLRDDWEDNDMGDPGYFFESMKNQSRKAKDLAARDAAIGALSEAARQERDRRALAKQFYERQALWDIGICPDCFYEVIACQCEDGGNELQP